jgi:hypothetical protein
MIGEETDFDKLEYVNSLNCFLTGGIKMTLCACGEPVCCADYSPDDLCEDCWKEEKAERRRIDFECHQEYANLALKDQRED